MRYHLLSAAVAFLLGLAAGTLAPGQEPGPPSTVGGAKAPPRETSAFAARETGVPLPESPPTRQIAHPPAAPGVGAAGGPAHGDPGPTGQSEQIRILTARWADQQGLIRDLETRMLGLEQELSRLRSERGGDEAGEGGAAEPALPVTTPEDRRAALVASGVAQTVAEEILWRQSTLALERLELQDQAMREEWFGTERYYQALRELNRNAVDLRTEIGEEAYDEYLYVTGESNRVKVRSVIQGSAAELSGLLPGDVIERYGDARIYNYRDLRSATVDGLRGETVPLLIRRGDSYFEAEITRGPMGIRLESHHAPPSG